MGDRTVKGRQDLEVLFQAHAATSKKCGTFDQMIDTAAVLAHDDGFCKVTMCYV